MQFQWSALFLKGLVWLSAEILLTLLGLDDLADYSEFLFHNRNGVAVIEVSMNPVTTA
jgi:hypothetical protein